MKISVKSLVFVSLIVLVFLSGYSVALSAHTEEAPAWIYLDHAGVNEEFVELTDSELDNFPDLREAITEFEEFISDCNPETEECRFVYATGEEEGIAIQEFMEVSFQQEYNKSWNRVFKYNDTFYTFGLALPIIERPKVNNNYTIFLVTGIIIAIIIIFTFLRKR
jgi:hypothetical protein